MSGENLAYLTYCLQAFCFGLFLINAGKLKYHKTVVLCLYVLGMLLIQCLFWSKWVELQQLRTVCYYLFLFLSIWIMLDEPPKRRLFIFAVFFIIILLTDTLGTILCMVCWGLTFTELYYRVGSYYQQILCSASFPSYFMPFATAAMVYLNHLERPVRRKVLLLSMLLAVSQTMLLIGIGIYNWDGVQDSMVLYVIVCEAVATLSQYYVYQTIQSSVRAVQSQMELEQLKLQRDLDYRYYRLAQESAAELSTFRHDFKNQLQVAYALAKREPEQAASLLGELEERLNAIRPLRYCANPIVNTVLTVKAAQAEEQGIGFTAQAAVDDWSLEEIDLSSLFSNLLDNAIEGCRRSGAKHPSIQVKAAERKGFYLVRVTNTCEEDVQTGSTSKQDKQGHGLGLSILRSIAQKYCGELRTSVENGVFTAEIVMEACPQ
ncbi:MAG: sensor histidine kinase [Candidatus Onthomonas sp.]